MRLQNKIAVVTGGTSGIGRAIALELASEGAFLAIFGQSKEKGDKILQEIQAIENNGGAEFFSLDAAKSQPVDEAIRKIGETRGPIDILVNSAGIAKDQLLLRMKDEEWDRVMEVNVKSAFNTARASLRYMIREKRGKIILISSIVGIVGNAGQTNYAASKAALIGFTKSLAKEVASRNIHVNCIAPGFIETPMTEALNSTQIEKIKSQIPLGRLGLAEEVAHMALFLSLPLSDYITGQLFVVDGGLTMSLT